MVTVRRIVYACAMSDEMSALLSRFGAVDPGEVGSDVVAVARRDISVPAGCPACLAEDLQSLWMYRGCLVLGTGQQ